MLSGVNKILLHFDWYRTSWQGAEKFVLHNSKNLDVVNLGSGGGFHAFNYEGLNIKAENWALWPQSIEQDFAILKQHVARLKPGATVIFASCPFICIYHNELNRRNDRYYGILTPELNPTFDACDAEQRALYFSHPFRAIGVTKCCKRSIKEVLRRLRHRNLEETSCHDFSREADQMMESWIAEFDHTSLEQDFTDYDAQVYQRNVETYRQLLQYCVEKGFRPVMVFPPIHPELARRFTPHFKERYISKFYQTVLSGIECAYFDWLEDPEFRNDELFQTPYFLSPKGAKKFTNKFLKELGLL